MRINECSPSIGQARSPSVKTRTFGAPGGTQWSGWLSEWTTSQSTQWPFHIRTDTWNCPYLNRTSANPILVQLWDLQGSTATRGWLSSSRLVYTGMKNMSLTLYPKTYAAFCGVSFLMSQFLNEFTLFAHVILGNVTGSWEIVWWTLCQWNIPRRLWKIQYLPNQIRTQYTTCICWMLYKN